MNWTELNWRHFKVCCWSVGGARPSTWDWTQIRLLTGDLYGHDCETRHEDGSTDSRCRLRTVPNCKANLVWMSWNYHRELLSSSIYLLIIRNTFRPTYHMSLGAKWSHVLTVRDTWTQRGSLWCLPTSLSDKNFLNISHLHIPKIAIRHFYTTQHSYLNTVPRSSTC